MLNTAKGRDILEAKGKRISTYQKRFDMAVEAVNTVIAALTDANSSIDRDIEEIAAYQVELDTMTTDLTATKKKNTLVLKNFEALIGKEAE